MEALKFFVLNVFKANVYLDDSEKYKFSITNAMIYQEYSNAMSKLSLGIMELLGISLGVGQSHFDPIALSIGRYKSCLHRAVVNKMDPPKSLAIDSLGGHQVPLIILRFFYVSFMAIINEYRIPF